LLGDLPDQEELISFIMQGEEALVGLELTIYKLHLALVLREALVLRLL
jgi:hypothetical protein